MRFIFKARTQDGETREGIVEALDRAAAIRTLQKENLLPVSVQKEREGLKVVDDLKRVWEGVNAKELSVFFRELATLIHAKVPIVQALRSIEEQADNKFLRFIVKDISADIEDGVPFSDALAKYPDVFSPLIISVVKSGEVSGTLQSSIMFIADNLEKSYQLTSRIRSALFYPAFVVLAAGIIGFLTVTFILPNLTQVIKDFDIPNIPWYTVVVMALGDFMAAYWWAVLLIIFAIIGGVAYYINTDDGRREWDHVKLKLPIFGKLFRMIYVARFAQNFSLLLTGGIPIVRALNITANVVDNAVYQGIILRAADEVRAGGTISSTFMEAEEVPSMVSRMMKIGEETGKMDETLKSVSDFYEEEIGVMTRNLTTLLEPILIVVLGIGVGILVAAILLPIYNITSSF